MIEFVEKYWKNIMLIFFALYVIDDKNYDYHKSEVDHWKEQAELQRDSAKMHFQTAQSHKIKMIELVNSMNAVMVKADSIESLPPIKINLEGVSDDSIHTLIDHVLDSL